MRRLFFAVVVVMSTVAAGASRAAAENAAPYTFVVAGVPVPATALTSGEYVTAALSGQPVQISIPSAVAGDTVAGGGAACSADRCSFTVTPSQLVQRFVFTLTHAGAVTALPPLIIVSLPGTGMSVVSPGTVRYRLPADLGELQLAFSTTASIVVDITSPETTPLAIHGTLPIASASAATLDGSASLSVNGTTVPVTATFANDRVHLSGGAATFASTIASVAVTGSNITADIDSSSFAASADARSNEPMLGTLSAQALSLTKAAGTLQYQVREFAWKPAGPIALDRVQLAFDAATLAVSSGGNASTWTIVNPVLTACNTKSTLPSLTFANGALVGDDGKAGSALSLRTGVALPLFDQCVSATNVHVSTPTATSLAVAFDASYAPSWLTGTTLNGQGLFARFDSSGGGTRFGTGSLTLRSPGSFAGFPVISATLSVTAEGLSLAANVAGLPVNARLTNGAAGVDVSNPQIAVNGFSLGGSDAKLELHGGGPLPSTLTIADGVITLPGDLGKKITVRFGPNKTTLTASVDATGNANVDWPDLQVSSRSGGLSTMTIGPLRWTFARYPQTQRDQFAQCKTSVAAFSASGHVILCGKLEIADASTASALHSFCTLVGGDVSADGSFAVATLRNAPTDPKTSVTDASDCHDAFQLGQVLQARLVDFSTLVPKDDKAFDLQATVIVKPLSIPGLKSDLFDSALFRFRFKGEEAALAGTISALEPFSVPNVVNYKVSSLDIMATYSTTQKGLDIVLSAGDSVANFPLPFPFIVYGKGGGLKYHTQIDDPSKTSWTTHFPGVKVRETMISIITQLLTSGGAYSILKHMTRL